LPMPRDKEKGTRDVLAENLKALMSAQRNSHLNTLKKITAATDGALSNGKLDRIRRGAAATDLDSLDLLAKLFKVEPWQLLVAGLNADALPTLSNADLLRQIRALVSVNGKLSPEQVNPVEPSKPEDYKLVTTKKRVQVSPELEETLVVGSKGAKDEVSKPRRVQKPRGSRRA
jgi:hypothetical protein